MTDQFGAYLDALQRLLMLGYVITYRRSLQTIYVTARTSTGEVVDTARGRTLSHPTIRLADRLAPGAR